MNVGKTLFAQVMEYVPWKIFGLIVDRHGGDAGGAPWVAPMYFAWLDLRGTIPAFIHISDGKMGDVNVLDLLLNF